MVKRIMHVDDEELIREYMSDFLSGFYPDVELCSFETWAEAKEQLAKGVRFDLIFLDEVMPDISGTEIFDQICQFYPNMREAIVFLTGSKSFNSTGRPFIKKPFDINEMHRTIKAAIV